MDHREQVAHHEAAHVVVAFVLGAGIPDDGIDIDAPGSVEGAFGHAGVNLITDDSELPDEERMMNLVRNLEIICAGAVSDAKLLGGSLGEALDHQPGDKAVALEMLVGSPFTTTDELREQVLSNALKKTERLLEDPDNWNAVQEVARECIEAKGSIGKPNIHELLVRTGLIALEEDSCAADLLGREN